MWTVDGIIFGISRGRENAIGGPYEDFPGGKAPLAPTSAALVQPTGGVHPPKTILRLPPFNTVPTGGVNLIVLTRSLIVSILSCRRLLE